MDFDGGLVSTELSPGEEREAEVDGLSEKLSRREKSDSRVSDLPTP